MCTAISNAGLFTGLWDGLIAVFSLIAGIFWGDVKMYNQCQNSWFYQLGFFVGLGLIGFVSLSYSWLVFVVMFFVWLAWVLSGIAIYAVIAGLAIIGLLFIISNLPQRRPS